MYFISLLKKIFIRNHLSIRIVLSHLFSNKKKCVFLTMGEHIFSREFVSRVTIALCRFNWRKKRWLSLIRCQNDRYRERSGRSGIRSLLQRGLRRLTGHLTFLCGLISWVPKEIRVRSARSPPSRLFFSVSDTNRRTTRRRDFDLVKSSGQLSSPERVDNAIISRGWSRAQYRVQIAF